MRKSWVLLSLLLLAGCHVTPIMQVDCDPNKDKCYSVSGEILNQYLFTSEQNRMLKDNIRECRKRL